MGNAKLDKKLRKAAINGDVAEIGRLIDAGADIESHGGFFTLGLTPLGNAIFNGKYEAAKYLLERGANPNARDTIGDTVLWMAVSYNRVDEAELLIRFGADPRAYCDMSDRGSVLQVAHHGKDQRLIDIIERGIAEAERRDVEARQRMEQAARDRKKARAAEEHARNKDIVIFDEQLGDRTLQEIYNFSSLERISLIRKGEDGPVEAMQRQDFADIGDKPGLRRAFDEHRRRGGTVEEAAIFPRLSKPLKKAQP